MIVYQASDEDEDRNHDYYDEEDYDGEREDRYDIGFELGNQLNSEGKWKGGLETFGRPTRFKNKQQKKVVPQLNLQIDNYLNGLTQGGLNDDYITLSKRTSQRNERSVAAPLSDYSENFKIPVRTKKRAAKKPKGEQDGFKMLDYIAQMRKQVK